MQKITDLIGKFIGFINGVIVPLVFAIAFLLFLVGVFRYFIQGASNPEMRKQGGTFVAYAIGGFVLMMSLWGIVNIAKNSLGLDSNTRPCLPTFGSGCINGTTSGSNTTTSGNSTTPPPTNLLPTPQQNEPTDANSGLQGTY